MKRCIYLVAILFLAANSFGQGHFVLAFSGNGQDQMNINIVSASIAGISLESGDEIAAFDGTVCCGKIILKQPIDNLDPNTFVSIAASRKDDGISNGYTIGDPISIKFWDSSKGLEISGVKIDFLNLAGILTSTTYEISGSAFMKLSTDIIVNKIPIANAGTDQSVNEGVTVFLDGSASSDPDGKMLTFSWTVPQGIILSSTTVSNPSFTAPEVSISTNFTLYLMVSNGIVSSVTDPVVIQVNQVNKTPVANAGNDQSVNEGSVVTLTGKASSDPDNNFLTYLWSAPAGITLSSTKTSNPTFTAPEVNVDTQYTFSLVVNDGKVNSPADQVVITVFNVDHAPYLKSTIKDVIVGKNAPDQSIDLNTIFQDDDQGDHLTFLVSSSDNDQVVQASISGSSLILSFSSGNTGSSDITITASSNGKQVQTSFKVDVSLPTVFDLINETPQVQIYPNPTKGLVQIKFPNVPVKKSWINVFYSSGSLILRSLATKSEEMLNLAGYKPGLYFIRIGEQNSKTYKLVLE